MFLTVSCYFSVISQSFIAKANYTISMVWVYAYTQPLKEAKINTVFTFFLIHVIPNLCDILFSVEHKQDVLKNVNTLVFHSEQEYSD